MSALVSVIIPNYNYAEYLINAIDSVLAQDYEPLEVIVVDDGSTDNSREILRSYKSRIKTVEIENSGAPTARNFGFIKAEGSYIAYLDADDYWLPDKISCQMQRLRETKAELVYCRMLVVDSITEAEGESTESREGNFRNEFLFHPGHTPFPPSTVLMTRELVAKAGLWDSTFKSPAEDFDYFRRCAKYTDFVVVDRALVVHRNHGKSLTSTSLRRYFADNRLALVKLFSDEYPELNFLQRRKSWMKLNIAFFKTFLKVGHIKMSFKCILDCLLPISL